MPINEIVSIIVPVFNVERYLPRCLESIFAQTYRNINVILVDDGSTDESGRICDEAATVDARFTVIHKVNGGLSDARNSGLGAANGKWVFFLDSDDYISPYCIETMLGVAHASEAEIVECMFVPIDNTTNMEWERPTGGYELYRQPKALERFLDYNGTWIMAWNKLYRMNLFDEIRFPVGKLNEDEFTIPYLVEKTLVYASLEEPLYAYVQREGSIMHSAFSSRKLDGLEALLLRFNYYSRLGDRRIDAINAYHLLARCRTLELEYQVEMDERHRRIVSDAREQALRVKVTPHQGIHLFMKSILMRYLPNIVLRLRGGAL